MPRYGKGDVLHGYKLLQDFKLVGQCEYTFASRDGEEFFLKKFLDPIYPIPSAPGSEKTKKLQRKQCDDFEKNHTAIMNALKGKSVKGGNLIITLDFFREESHFYKVTTRVNVAGVDISDISALSYEKRILVLLTVANSLKLLHQSNIVHGDLKPDNILINKTEADIYVAKLIDFDSSYFTENPPAEVVGDPVYYSPELGRYIQFPDKRTPHDLQLKSDIFALGLIYHQYLTGELPSYNTAKYKYAYAAVLDGTELTLNDAVPSKLTPLLCLMLKNDYNQRPDITQIMSYLKEDDKKKFIITEPKGLGKTEAATPRLKIPMELTKSPKPLEPKPVEPKSEGKLSIFKGGTI
jgi:serine/threonine protein kinase